MITEIEKQYEWLKWNNCFLIVENNGKQIGWIQIIAGGVERKTESDIIGDHIEPFSPDSIMPSTTSVFDAIELLKNQWFIFCQERNRIVGVFDIECFEKLSLKYLLFGIALQIEESLTRGIRLIKLTNAQILERLSPERAKSLEKRLARDKYSTAIEIITLADKITIFLNDYELFRILPFANKESADDFLDRLRKLRNRIAHGVMIIDLIRDPSKFIVFVTEMNQLAKHLESNIPADPDQ